jgi:diguanylate cyclase (GGDEF)-like protein
MSFNLTISTSVQWWKAQVEDHPHLLVLGLWIACIPIVFVLLGVKLDGWKEEEINVMISDAKSTLEHNQLQLIQDFDTTFNHLKGLPEFLSLEPKLISMLDTQQTTPQLIDAANRYLKNAARYLSVDLAFVMDKDGFCIAANNVDTAQNIMGISYQDRRYFQEAIQGGFGGQYAFGRVTNIPGLYFSAPVRNEAKKIIGVVAIKIDLPKVTSSMKLDHYFLTDDQGVIIAASNPSLIFKTLANAPILQQTQEMQQQRYKRHAFLPYDIRSAHIPNNPEVQGLDDIATPVLIRRIDREQDGFTAYLIEPLPLLARINEHGSFVFMLAMMGVAAALWTMIASFVFTFRARHYRKKIQQSHDALIDLNERLKQQAQTDFLTGCINRRYFDLLLKEQLILHKQQNTFLSMALFDIDFFKRINDTFGHDIGDKVLQHVCHIVQYKLNENDRLARIGGEEFAILMPNTDIKTAEARMESVRNDLAQTPLLYGELLPIPATISIGVTRMCANDTAGSLLHRADDGMYRAKENGRNQVVVT